MDVLEDPELMDSDLFRGRSYPASRQDQKCPHCRTYFGSDGIDSHQENCPVLDEEKIDEEAAASILDECDECGYLGESHAAGCSRSGVDGLLAEWKPVV